jgi:hypothetical protein
MDWGARNVAAENMGCTAVMDDPVQGCTAWLRGSARACNLKTLARRLQLRFAMSNEHRNRLLSPQDQP